MSEEVYGNVALFPVVLLYNAIQELTKTDIILLESAYKQETT